MAGARGVQSELLERYPDQEIAVYAIWFKMFWGDSRSGWDPGLLTDSRVEHFWDETKLVGKWYGEQVTAKSTGHVEWDAWFLYGPGGEWDELSTKPIDWGRTIVGTRTKLKEQMSTILGSRGATGD